MFASSNLCCGVTRSTAVRDLSSPACCIFLSLEEGLLLLANPVCQAIVKSCLAAARALYPVRICHLIVDNPHPLD